MITVAARFYLLAVLSGLVNCLWPHTVFAEPPACPSLSETVLFGLRPIKELKQDNYSKAGQACVRKYLDAIPKKAYLWVFKVPAKPEEALHVRKRNLIEQMVTILGENVRSEAAAFASAVPLQAEWEGMSEGPVNEADFAQQWLDKRPGTSIAPFLYLFRAHRLRAGYEAARAGHETGLWPVLARRYRESLDRARSSANPLISCIAGDLEAQACVYLAGQGRP